MYVENALVGYRSGKQCPSFEEVNNVLKKVDYIPMGIKYFEMEDDELIAPELTFSSLENLVGNQGIYTVIPDGPAILIIPGVNRSWLPEIYFVRTGASNFIVTYDEEEKPLLVKIITKIISFFNKH